MTTKAKPRVGKHGGTVLAWAVYASREPGCISTSMIFEDRRTAKHVAGTRLVFPVEIREIKPKRRKDKT